MTNPFIRPIPDGARAPKDVVFEEVRAEPAEDYSRIKIFVKLSPFEKPQDLHFQIMDSRNSLLAETTIIENTEYQFVFTMHLKNNGLAENGTLLAQIDYGEEYGITHSFQTNI